jgi:hypothetical protein
MNHSRGRLNARFGVGRRLLFPLVAPLASFAALAFLPACGSGAAPSSSSSSEGAQASSAAKTSSVKKLSADRSSAASRNSSSAAPRGLESFEGEDESDDAPVANGPRLFLCMRDPVAFDLSELSPAGGTPTKFVEAWRQVRSHTDVPGFVAVLSGTRAGPDLKLQVGPVRQASAGAFGFMKSLPPSNPVVVGLYPEDLFHLRSPEIEGDFIAALGQRRNREGFVISNIKIDGQLDADCSYLKNVTVEMTLPASRNTNAVFGNRTVDEALGPVVVDSNHDGDPDSWVVTLTGPSLQAMDFKL